VLSFAIWKKLADLITFWVAHPEMIPNLFNADIGIAKSYLYIGYNFKWLDVWQGICIYESSV